MSDTDDKMSRQLIFLHENLALIYVVLRSKEKLMSLNIFKFLRTDTFFLLPKSIVNKNTTFFFVKRSSQFSRVSKEDIGRGNIFL